MVLKLVLDHDLEKKFREVAMRRFGFSKGSLKKASELAIKHWVCQEEKQLPKTKDYFSEVKGIMKHLRGKYTSVQLQHEAMELWAKKT